MIVRHLTSSAGERCKLFLFTSVGLWDHEAPLPLHTQDIEICRHHHEGTAHQFRM